MTADVKKALVSIANEIIVLADSSKFDRVSLYKILDCRDAGTVITDAGLDAEITNEFRENGISLDIVDLE